MKTRREMIDVLGSVVENGNEIVICLHREFSNPDLAARLVSRILGTRVTVREASVLEVDRCKVSGIWCSPL